MKTITTNVFSKVIITSSLLLLCANVSLAQMVIHANINISPGTFVHIDTDVELENATLKAEEGSTIIMGDNRTLEVGNNGTLDLKGSGSEKVKVTSAGYFVFIVSNGGSISADRVVFEKMSGNGLEIQEGATVDPAFPLSNSTFRNGSQNSTLLTINNSQVLFIDQAKFESVPGMELYNVAKTVDVGEVTFTSFSGNFAGENFENDIYYRIHWSDVPLNMLLENITIEDGNDDCFAAHQTITVGGNGSHFIVENGGSASLVAGYSIMLLPGVLVEAGGKLHAYIDSDGVFCTNGKALVAAIDPAKTEVPDAMSSLVSDISIYPNPTRNMVNVDLSGSTEAANTKIEVFGFLGEKIIQEEVSGIHTFRFDLTNQPAGIYIIRVMNGGQLHVGKVIKQ